MDKNTNLLENAEYKEIVDEIKSEYKKKIQAEVESAKKEMSRQVVGVLGNPFVELFSQRKKLIDQFGKQTKIVLDYAVQHSMVEDINRLSKWSKDCDNELTKKGDGNKLFEQLLDKIEQVCPDLVTPIRKTEFELELNNKKINELVNQKKSVLQNLEKQSRDKLRKTIMSLVIEFNKRILVVNESFGLKSDQKLQIFDNEEESLSLSLDENEEDNLFIPVGNGDIIN